MLKNQRFSACQKPEVFNMKKELLKQILATQDIMPSELDYYDSESIEYYEEEGEIDGYDSGFMTGYLAA